MASSKCFDHKLLVATITIGTIDSGYAFSLKSDPMRVSFPNTWTHGSNRLLSLKTSTTLLLNPDKSFGAFGFEAEDIYSAIAEEDIRLDYFFFRRFKKELFNKSSSTGIKSDMEIEDENGRKMNALSVFGMSIKYIKEHLLGTLRSRGSDWRDSDVGYVLTVPSPSNYGYNQFMREAAEAAGIQASDLMIALEPEAASVYCMNLPVDKMYVIGSQQPAEFTKGTKFMVVNSRREVVDMTVLEALEKGYLRELAFFRAEKCGVNSVDEEFTKFIINLFGQDVFDKFAKDADDLESLYREFETKKRTIKLESNFKQTLKVPVSLGEKYQEVNTVELKNALKERREFEGKVAYMGDKLRMASDIMKDFFTESCNLIVEHVKDLLKKERCKDTDIIFLVGMFAEYPLLQEVFNNNFPDIRVIVPEYAGFAVFKGAVQFGHNPLTIVPRGA